MTEPRVDLKIGIDFDESLEAQVQKKFQQLGADIEAAFGKTAAPAAEKVASAVKDTARATDEAREKLRDYGAAGSVVTGLWAAWNLVSGAVRGVANSTIAAGRALLDAQIFAERFAITMKLATGGNSAGEMEYVRGVVNKLGIELQGAAHYYAQFMAASRDTRLEGQRAREVFEAVSAASAVMGLSAYDTEGVFRALTQMISKGTVQAEEMRGQLGERLPGAFQIAARAMGVTTGEFSKMLERGQVISTEFLPQFGRQLREEFGGSVEQASQRTEASLNRLSTAWLEAKTATAQAGVGRFIAGELDRTTEFVNDFAASMRRATAEGAGFWGKVGAGLGALWRDMSGTGVPQMLRDARTELAELETALEAQPNNLLLKNALADTKRLVTELETAQSKAAALMSRDNRDPRDFVAQRITDQSVESTERYSNALAALQKVMIPLSGVSDEYQRVQETVNRVVGQFPELAQAGNVALALAKQRYTEAGKEAERAGEQAATYRRQLEEKVGALEDAAAASEKLTKGERVLAELEREWAGGRVRITAAERDLVRARLDRVIATEKAERADAAAEKSAAALLKLDLDSIAAEGKRIEALTASVQKQAEENAAIGLTKEAVAQLAIGKQELLLVDMQRKALLPELSDAELNALNSQIALQERLIALMKDGAAKRASADAAEEAAKEWRRASEDIERSLTDALVRGFEGGRSVLRSIGDWIVNYFKTSIAGGISRAIVSGMGSALSSSGAGSGLLSLLGLAAPGAAGASGGGGGAGLSMLGSLINGGSGLAAGLWSGISGAGSMAAMSGLWAGGSYGAAAGMGLGMAAPYAAAAYGLYRVLSGVGTGRDRAPGYQQYGLTGPQGLGYAANTPNLALGGAGYYDDLTRAVADGVAAAVRGFGGTVGATTYGLYTSTGSEGSGAYLRADVASGSGRALFGTESNASNDSLQDRIAAALPAMILAGLQDADLPGQISEYFRGIDLAGATQEQVDAAIAAATTAMQLAAALRELGPSFGSLAGMSVQALTGMADLAGGLDSLRGSLATYYQEFYSEAEREASLRRGLTSALAEFNLELPASREAFRALVESQAALGESGVPAVTALLGMAGAFAQLVPASVEAGEAVEDTVTALRSAADIARERAGLERQLLTLEGDTAALRSLDLAALDESNRALQQRIWSLQDERDAAEAARAAQVAMLAAAGISADKLGGLISDGLLGRVSREDLGGQLGEMLVGGIEEALAGQLAGSVAQLFTETVVSPILTAVLTGAEIAGAVSQRSIDAVVARANEAAAAFTAVLNDPGFQSALDGIRAAVAGIAGSVAQPGAAAGGGGSAVPAGWTTWVDQHGQVNWSATSVAGTPAATGSGTETDASRAAAEAYRLQTTWLQLMGETAELRQRELALLDPSNRALQELIWAKQDELAANEAAARIAEAAAEATRRADEARYQAAQALFADGRSLEVQYLEALGDREGALARAREFAIAGMDAELVAYYDANAATRALIESTREAAAAESRRAAEQDTLQARLLQAQGDIAALRERELAALDPANRALQQQIWALEDAAAAADAAARATAEAAAVQRAIDDERAGLQRRLWELEGNTAEIRAAELAALDATNRSLLESIWAREEEARAIAEAAAATRARAQEEAGLMRQLYQVQGDTAALRTAILADLDPANQWIQLEIWRLEDAATAAAEAQRAADEAQRASDAAAREAETLQRQLQQAATQAAQELVTAIESVADLLGRTVKDLLGEAGAGMSAAQGRAFIEQSLAVAKATGYLPEEASLAEAIAAVRSGLDNGNFATRTDANRARLTVAALLAEFEGVANAQLAGAQASLAAAQSWGGTAGGAAAPAASTVPTYVGTAGTPAPAAAGASAAAEISALRQEMALLRAEAQAIAQHTNATRRIFERARQPNDALLVEVAP